MRRTAEERSILSAIATVRLAVPEFARTRAISSESVRRAAEVFNIDLIRAPIEVPAMLSCAIGGKYFLALRENLPHYTANFITLHEVSHVIREDVREPTMMLFTGNYPEFENACDTFALMGMLDAAEFTQGSDYVEQRIRELVPLEDRGWQLHRIHQLAPRAVRMRALIDEWLD